MKVALIVPGGVDRGGEERVIPCLLWMIERLARQHEVHVFALLQEPRPAHYKLLGAQVHNAGARPRRARLLAQFIREHRRGRFYVVHAIWAAPPGVLAAVLGALLGIPVLLRLTGGDLCSLPEIRYGQRSTWRGRAWLRWAVRGAARITVPSRTLQAAAAVQGIQTERLPWGVATDRWPPAPPRARELDRPARLLFVGTLNKVKDPTTLVRAAEQLRTLGVSFQLDVVGEDLTESAVAHLARRLGLDDCTTFHGFQPQARVRSLMRGADLLLVTSLHEADPIVALEAAVSGTPIVGTAVGHLLDWAPEAAVVVPPGDPEALAAAAASLLAQDDRRMEIARAAQARALEEDMDHSAARVLQIYDELIDSST